MKSTKKSDTTPATVPPGKYKATMNEYDAKRPKRQVMTRVSK